MTYDAVIIGAGPAGSTTALLLAKAGWSVALVEKARFPRRKVCGEFISATSLPLLHTLGVGQSFLQHAGPPVRRVGLFAQDAELAANMPQVLSGEPWGRALGREHLDNLLRDAAMAAGAELWQPWRAVALTQMDDGYAITLRGEGTRDLAARVVIAAYGSWEQQPWGAAADHADTDLLAFKAHFTHCDLPPDLMPLLAFPGGYGGLVHTNDGRTTLSCCIRRDVLRLCRARNGTAQAGDAVLQHVMASCAGVRNVLRGATREGPWLAAGPICPGMRARYRDGMFYVGNIAGEAHPIVAEGISMAMQSAALLCGRLASCRELVGSARVRAQIGRRYDTDWRAAFSVRLRAAALFAGLAVRPLSAVLGLHLLEACPRLLSWGAVLSGKSKPLLRTG